ncbi:MAG: hypothetical protein HYY18_18695 [Planctomycetes bacterium]|nr:hypothetical protein [Planctomycetota bacterium]
MRRRFGRAAWTACILAMTAAHAPSDTVILRDGTVLECRIKDCEYPDPKDKTRFRLVVEIDGQGTIRQIKGEDIARKKGNQLAVTKGPTSWERRAESLKVWEKKVEALKTTETWEARVQLGKWCHSQGLPDKGDEQFKAAVELRVQAIEKGVADGRIRDAIGEHLKLAAWCEQALALPEAAEQERSKAYELRTTELGGAESAEALLDLARWCEQSGLEKQAGENYGKILKGEPGNAAAKTGLGRIRGAQEARMAKFTAELDKPGRALHLTVAIEDDADKAFLDEWAGKIQELSEYIFVITEGQFFVADCEIRDKSSSGKILIMKGKLDWKGIESADGFTGKLAWCPEAGTPGWYVTAAGRIAVSVLCHEVFHGIFGLNDEYDKESVCQCVMAAAPNVQQLCDGRGHVEGGKKDYIYTPGTEGWDCWRVVQKRFPGVAHPNPNWKWSDPAGNKQQPWEPTDFMDGTRSVGGELSWNGLRLKSPPRTVVRLKDN